MTQDHPYTRAEFRVEDQNGTSKTMSLPMSVVKRIFEAGELAGLKYDDDVQAEFRVRKNGEGLRSRYDVSLVGKYEETSVPKKIKRRAVVNAVLELGEAI